MLSNLDLISLNFALFHYRDIGPSEENAKSIQLKTCLLPMSRNT